MKLTIEITASDTLVRAIETFALAMAGGKFEQKTVNVEPEKAPQLESSEEANPQGVVKVAASKPKGKGKVTKVEKVEELTQEAEETTEEVTQEPTQEGTGETNQEPETKPTISIEAIRQLMKSKLTPELKPQVIAMLSGFGAGNVTTLEPKHYDEFYNQLSAL